MNKSFLIFLVIVLLVAGLLFWDQVLTAFAGMTVMEAMKQIVSFVLHVLWVTILGFVLTMLSQLARPWIRMFLQKQKRARRQEAAGRIRTLVDGNKVQIPRGNKDQALLWMIQQMAKGNASKPAVPSQSLSEEKRIKLDF